MLFICLSEREDGVTAAEASLLAAGQRRTRRERRREGGGYDALIYKGRQIKT